MEREGCVALWTEGSVGGTVFFSTPYSSLGSQGLGGGVECYHQATELSPAYSNSYLLELQKQENIAVTKKSTHFCSLGVYSSVRKIRNIY